MTRVRMLVATGTAAVALGSVIIAVLHLVGPGAAVSPVRRTISEYGLTSAAWIFNAAVLAVAAGSAGILVAVALIRRPGRSSPGRVGLLLGALWVVGMVTLVAFPKTDWAIGPSLHGHIHRAASLVAFIALPLAVLALLRHRTPRGAAASGMARTAVALAVVGLAWFTPIVVAIVAVGQGGAWWLAVPLGLVERGMAVTEIAALLALGRWAVRAQSAAAIDPVTNNPVPSDRVPSDPVPSDPVPSAPAPESPVTDPAMP